MAMIDVTQAHSLLAKCIKTLGAQILLTFESSTQLYLILKLHSFYKSFSFYDILIRLLSNMPIDDQYFMT